MASNDIGPEGHRSETGHSAPDGAKWAGVAVFWAFVGIPLIWGIYQTLVKALQLF